MPKEMTGAQRSKWERIKAVRLARHLNRAPWDECARMAFDRLPDIARKDITAAAFAMSPADTRSETGDTLTRMKRGGYSRAA